MTREQIKRLGGPKSGSVAEGHSPDVGKLLSRVPQFSALAKAAEGREREVSGSQRAFLDDFAKRLAEGVADGDDRSRSTAAKEEKDDVGKA